ncbi:hypothetical protein H6P81_007359 [Aristolochia fimbriata]|uniref:Uncharacterized protein n=1 Tax=Aristolochia fimbriata TaxID=158543 RepID=A0AAV7F008_ARIFI|nr:hypothetical protein H6P81_007359 [Aristolochia fimbriata]
MKYNPPAAAKVSASAMENPFTLKVGQVFTGFGIGCGIGIGVGRPLNFGAIPALQQVMSATRGATDAFSGVGQHLNGSLRRLGIKSIEAGIGCGVGVGHGFGVGLSLKPGVMHRIQSFFTESAVKMMSTVGLPRGSSTIPGFLQDSTGKTSESSNKVLQNKLGNSLSSISKGTESSSPSIQSEKVIHNFLQNPVLKDEEEIEVEKLAAQLKSENNVLQMLLKHQKMIEELMEENNKLRHVLIEDLKVPPSKLQNSEADKNSK